MAKSCIDCGAEKSLHRYWMDGRFRTFCSNCLADQLISELDNGNPIRDFLDNAYENFTDFLDEKAAEEDECCE